jgi:glyceraldehyde 3-phosphate dehydrogenase
MHLKEVLMRDSKVESYLDDWSEEEEIAESMIPLIGKLYRDYGVVTTVYGRSLVRGSTIDILKAHRFSRQILKDKLSVASSCRILQAVSRLNLAPTRIDIGKLTTKFEHDNSGVDEDVFVRGELAEINTGQKRSWRSLKMWFSTALGGLDGC